ncbi:MAG TPA: MerR family transcriptional regulator [Calditrichaeota bacterium]|nr:MerR family transcriptional regulator [Calditrichota bacterium]
MNLDAGMEIKNIYFTIGQVSEHVSLPQSVLRYWETVFDALNPQKSRGGNRRYSKEDIEIIQQIKELLYEQGFTIKGANKQLNILYQAKYAESENENTESTETIAENAELNEIPAMGEGGGSINVKAIKQRLQEIIRILE